MPIVVNPLLRMPGPRHTSPQVTILAYDGEEAILFVHNSGGDGVFTAEAQIITLEPGPIGHAAPYQMLWRDTTTHEVSKNHECLIPSDDRAKLLLAQWQSGGDWGKPSLVLIGDKWSVDEYRHEPWDKRSPTVTIEVTIRSTPALAAPFKRRYSVCIPPKTIRKVVVVDHDKPTTP